MDEPTTHLDIHTVESLTLALERYEGTLVFISHDVHFIRQLATKVLHVNAGEVVPYAGGYDYFLEKTGTTEDARAAHQLASLGRAQQQRAEQALAEIDRLAQFRPPPLPGTAAIGVGAIVEVEDADSGEGRTFFLAPVGAGITLTGPGGDGHLSVVTPASPIGRAVLGRRSGDVVDISVDGDLREWAITYVG
jgi:transcription elongation GreA/GreB family factor